MDHIELARMGGNARRDALTPAQRKKIAKKAVRARIIKANGGVLPKKKGAK